MENEQEKKSKFINENIISKGYNLEDLSNFIMNESQKNINELQFSELKELINRFKNKGLIDIYKVVKQRKVKPENPLDLLYAQENFEFITQQQEDNKLLQLEKANKRINVIINEPKKESTGGFFSKNKFSYCFQCQEINSDIRRTYLDVEWLRGQLNIFYPLRFLPPLIKEPAFIQLGIINKQDSEEEVENKKVRYLNKYFNALLNKKIFRTSPILLNFLELNENEFKKYEESLNKKKYELSSDFSNFKNMYGKVQCQLNKEVLMKANSFNKNYVPFPEIFNKLEESLNNICIDFNNIKIHMKEISEEFQKFVENLKHNSSCGVLQNIYMQLSTIFSCWSMSYDRQKNFFNQEFREHFRYMDLELKELDHFYKKFTEIKGKFETQGIKLIKRKEELFNKKDFSKWDLEPGSENDLTYFQNDRKLSFEKMLYKETKSLNLEKKNLAFTIYFMNKQLNKLFKHQGERMKDFFQNIKNSNQVIIGEAYNLIKLFNLNIQ